LIKLDSQTITQAHFDVACVLIAQSSLISIDSVQVLKMGDERFDVKIVEELVGDLDLSRNRFSSAHSLAEASSRSSVKGWRGGGAMSDHGRRDDCSNDDSGDDHVQDPLGINRNQLPKPIGSATEDRDSEALVIATDPILGQVGDKALTITDGIVSNKGDEIQILNQIQEGDQNQGVVSGEKRVEFNAGRRC
jgi:hypothetical protein